MPGKFQIGIRYFMGAPVTREHCIDVLKNGYQRQRILAAHYLCLLDPGTPLFNTSAPAWRQQRLLAKMTWGAVAAKYILAGLAIAFLAASLMRLSRGGGISHPQTKTWQLIGLIFAVVSAWLFFQE
jgi:hypothetical protein